MITSRLRYDDRDAELPANEAVRGVDIRRVWSFRSGRDHLVERSLEYLSFYLSAGFCLWRLARRGDVIIAKTDPPLLSVLASIIAKLRGAQLINWLQDLFPEVAERLGVAGAAGAPTFHVAAAAAKSVAPLGNHECGSGPRDGEDASSERELPRERIEVIPNWSDGELIKPVALRNKRASRSLEPPADDIVVGYVGNFGRAHDFDTIIEAITLHQQRAKLAPAGDIIHNIVFLLVGGGAQRARCRARDRGSQADECEAASLPAHRVAGPDLVGGRHPPHQP